MLLEKLRDTVHQLLIQHRLLAFLTVNYRNGNAPETLTAQAPVRTHFHHALDTVFAVTGNPLHLLY
jgi:hypothetical protein